MTETEFAKIFVMLGVAYPHQETTEQTAKLYYELLKDFDVPTLRAAVLKAIAENETNWMPSIGMIRKRASEMMAAAAGLPMPYEAYELALAAVRNFGHARKPDLPEIVWRTILGIGGWREFCMSENPESTRARFIECYGQYKGRADSEQAALPAVNQHIAQLAAQMTGHRRLKG